jgi:hypothetical protein
MMATHIFYQVFLAFEACFPHAKYAVNFGCEPMFDGHQISIAFLISNLDSVHHEKIVLSFKI